MSCTTAKSTPFAVSKDEWDTKEDTGKSMKCIARTAVCQKARVHLKRHRTVKKIKPVALELCLSESISQSVTRKFHVTFFFVVKSS